MPYVKRTREHLDEGCDELLATLVLFAVAQETLALKITQTRNQRDIITKMPSEEIDCLIKPVLLNLERVSPRARSQAQLLRTSPDVDVSSLEDLDIVDASPSWDQHVFLGGWRLLILGL